TMQDLSCLLTRVDDIFRTPFLLDYEGFKYDEIAEKLGIPLGTVKSRIFFARKKMRQSIERVHY
ncbi:MAG: RNA polymerase sigma factor, partial [Bacteroidota bacterium]